MASHLFNRFCLVRHDEEAILHVLLRVPRGDRLHARIALFQALGGQYTNAGPRALALCERVFGSGTMYFPSEREVPERKDRPSPETAVPSRTTAPELTPVYALASETAFDQGRILTLYDLLKRVVSQQPFLPASEILALLDAAESHVAKAALRRLNGTLLSGEGRYGKTYYQILQQIAGEGVSDHLSGRRDMIERTLSGGHKAGRPKNPPLLPLETRLLYHGGRLGAGHLLGSWDKSATPEASVRRHAEAEESLSEEHPALAVLGQGGGEPLPAAVLARMNRLFGYDLSHVRIHTDAAAARIASLLGARALAFGTHVYFGVGQFSPGTMAGDRLLIHELTHVVQFDRGALPRSTGAHTAISRPEDAAEREATAMEERSTAVEPAPRSLPRSPRMAEPQVGIPKGARPAPVEAAVVLRSGGDPLDDLKQIAAQGDKSKVFDWLRRQPVPERPEATRDAPLTAAQTNKKGIKDFLRDFLGEKSHDFWLAERLVDYGPEPLWPASALEERAKYASGGAGIEADLGYTEGLKDAAGQKDFIKPQPIKAFFFPGKSNERALVIGGVHGSERSGVEVVEKLIERLKTGPQPYYTAIIVPCLFPDDREVAQHSELAMTDPQGHKDGNLGRYPVRWGTGRNQGKLVPKGRPSGGEYEPNRNFPAPGTSLEASEDPNRPGTYRDQNGDPILRENVMLLKLIERFQPSRIASVHAKHFAGSAERGKAAPGVFSDWRTTATDKPPLSKGDTIDSHVAALRERIRKLLASIAATTEAEKLVRLQVDLAALEGDLVTALGSLGDARLALAMAFRAEEGGANVPGNFLHGSKEKNKANPVTTYGSAPTPGGTSLGGWGPRAVNEVGGKANRKAMAVITIEVAGDTPSSEYKGNAKAAREKEIAAMATSLEEIFLGPAAATERELDEPDHRKEYSKGYLGLPSGEL